MPMKKIWFLTRRCLLRLRIFFEYGLLIVRQLQPLILLAALIGFLVVIFSDQSWPFSLSAKAGRVVVQSFTPGQTNWPLSPSSQLCVRSNLGGLETFSSSPESDAGRCGSSRWRELDLSGVAEPILELSAEREGAPFSARFEVPQAGGLALSLRSPEVGRIKLVSSDGSAYLLGDEIVAHYPASDSAGWAPSLTFPFAGALVVGADAVGGAGPLLNSGEILVYTREDQSASGRTLADSIPLLPGDRVDVAVDSSGSSLAAKGFIRAVLATPDSSQPQLGIDVVAFGSIDDVRIVRFGEPTQAFAPSIWARIVRHSLVGSWLAGLFGVLGLMAMYREGADLGSHDLISDLEQKRDRFGRLLEHIQAKTPSVKNDSPDGAKPS